MTPDEAARRRQLTRLTRIWRDLDQQAINEYLKATSDLTPTELETAIDQMIRERRTRPTPRDIRDVIHPTPPPPPPTSRAINLAPHHQQPGPDGIRPYIHDELQRARNTGHTTTLNDLLNDNLHPAEHNAIQTLLTSAHQTDTSTKAQQ